MILADGANLDDFIKAYETAQASTGQADLQAKVLRAIGDPATRIAEDKLRMLRAIRIAARF